MERHDERNRWLPVALAVGLVSAVFTGVVCGFLIAAHLRLSIGDPLNEPSLVDLRAEYEQDAMSGEYSEDIRRLDLAARRSFFTNQHRIAVGGKLAVGGVVLMLAALGLAQALDKKLPHPAGEPVEAAAWAAINRCRSWVAGTAVAVLTGAIALMLASRTGLAPEPAEIEPVKEPAVVHPSRAEMFANFPTFRGADGSGLSLVTSVPLEWNEQEGRNILWKVAVPLSGAGSPVAWGDRVYLSGATREKRAVFCFSVDSGELLWTGTYESDPAATVDYEVFDAPEHLMYAAPTPATDGRFVYAMFANGEIACFRAEGGEAAWSRLLCDTGQNMYGLANSPLVYKGSVIAMFHGVQSKLARFDGAGGNEIWSKERFDTSWASPILVRTAGGLDVVITHGDPETAGWDPETGEKLWYAELVSGDVAPSPTTAGGRVFVCFGGYGIFALDTESGEEVWRVEELPEGAISETQSMVTDGELVYHLNNSVLSVLDAADGSVAYEKVLDHDISYASPFVAGEHVYLPCGETTVVIRKGREYEEVAVCRIEERSDISPAVVNGRIYIRTEHYLYCIGER